MSNDSNKKIVTRFAPSPTGFVHVGGIRTALFAYLWARKHNGTFILRIEDTDKEREVEGSIEHIIESLKWLGLDWDEGPDIGGIHAPYIQSQRLDSYKKYAEILIDKNLAYADPYTEKEIEEFRAQADLEKRPFLYREHRPDNPPKWDKTMPLRLKIQEVKTSEWEDLVRGKLTAGPEALDDFILIKSDGYPTYNFAHIIDDLEMGVTHIMRADEFISSTPKFLALYEALGVDRPEMATLPPIMAPGGKKKLGKRDGAKDVLDYRNEGILPEAMINFLALLGWNPGDDREVMTINEILESFDVKKIQHSGAQFNEEKLAWINGEYIKKMSYEEQEAYLLKFIPNDIKSLPHFTNDMLHRITPIIIERISTGLDIEMMAVNGDLDYYFKFPKLSLDVLKKEEKENITTEENIKKVIESLSQINEGDWIRNTIKDALWEYATSVGRGSVLWPMRYALSGCMKSPDPFILAELFGKEGTLTRLNLALETLSHINNNV
ncbi:glutamate--tRNA ligase [Candidatus Nomurabacteria bacterium]|nr:glutamate--tRNA ligase [Candidatus Nomurabacteria bacterium]